MAKHDKEKPKLATGIEPGNEADVLSIFTGTVKMEKHPLFAQTIQQIEEDGFTVIIHGAGSNFAYVMLRLIEGDSRKIEKELHLVREMRWLDLQHEIGHIEQVLFRFLLQGELMVTEEVNIDNPDHKYSFVLKKWQDHVFEFHNRLIEFLELYKKGLDNDCLEKHLKGVLQYSDLFWRVATKKWCSQSRYDWILRFFPDIFELRNEVSRIHAKEFRHLIGRVK